MKILLIRESQDAQRILNQLLGKSRHRLEGRSLKDFPEPDLKRTTWCWWMAMYPIAFQQVNLLAGFGKRDGVIRICRWQ